MTVPFAQAIARTSYAAGSHVDGVWVDGASTVGEIQASVQPAGSATLLRLPEGDRTRGAVDIWSESELSVGDESAGLKPDEITWQGEQWVVTLVDGWRDGHHAPRLGHFKASAVRADR